LLHEILKTPITASKVRTIHKRIALDIFPQSKSALPALEAVQISTSGAAATRAGQVAGSRAMLTS
jgi:hypothetical protein